jgi:hypothetical protein
MTITAIRGDLITRVRAIHRIDKKRIPNGNMLATPLAATSIVDSRAPENPINKPIQHEHEPEPIDFMCVFGIHPDHQFRA